MEYSQYIENLNHNDVEIRLESLIKLKALVDEGKIVKPVCSNDVNNHIHTFYSFSPYSPSKALWVAYNSGLSTAGIMDHDSISGALEFIEAGRILGMSTTIGTECRVDFSRTPLNGKRINNPDQDSIVYMAIHGIPHTQIDTIKNFLAPYSKERNKRNISMIDKINILFKPYDISFSFENDVVPLSKSNEGGSITERHIIYALSLKMINKFGKGEKLVNFLKDKLDINISLKIEKLLLDSQNPFFEYDLLGALKSDLVASFYVDAAAECPDVSDVIEMAEKIGAISAYAYLGDVEDSVTGDKKIQKFEDDYLELLFEVIKDLGFNAVTYMPPRNTLEQLRRVKALCDKYDIFQISGVDINSPRQTFICKELKDKEFENLLDSTWALIGHEKAATDDLNKAMFSSETKARYPDLKNRIEAYKKIGIH